MITFGRYAKSETWVVLDGRDTENREGKRRRIGEAAGSMIVAPSKT